MHYEHLEAQHRIDLDEWSESIADFDELIQDKVVELRAAHMILPTCDNVQQSTIALHWHRIDAELKDMELRVDDYCFFPPIRALREAVGELFKELNTTWHSYD